MAYHLLGLFSGRLLANMCSGAVAPFSMLPSSQKLMPVRCRRPWDHLTALSLPRRHSLLAERRSRSYWVDSVMTVVWVVEMFGVVLGWDGVVSDAAGMREWLVWWVRLPDGEMSAAVG